MSATRSSVGLFVGGSKFFVGGSKYMTTVSIPLQNQVLQKLMERLKRDW
jgi:hypothetical protein